MRTCSAQTHESAFGEVRFFPLPAQFERSLLIPTADEGTITLAAWSGERREILFAKFDSSLSSVSFILKHTPIQFDNLYIEDITGDHIPDLILTNHSEKSIAFVFDVQRETLQVASIIQLPFQPTHILIGDYNNDKHTDILVYDQQTPGILPLIGNGKGKFTPGKILAQDNAIGAACFAYLNNDNLIDLVIWDWVKSELHMLYGVGRGRFIEQSVFPVQGEVSRLIATQMDRGRALDLILLMHKPSEFQLWERNVFGDFQLKNHIALDKSVNDFVIADVNDDGMNDIIASVNPASLQVIFNSENEPYSERIEYASGEDPQTIAVPTSEKSGNQDCIVFDRSGKQFIAYLNALRSGLMDDSVQLATGTVPAEIVSSDFNRDGVSDIALVNNEGRSVSIYWGRKNSFPDGPYSYSLTGIPHHLAFHSSMDTALHFILSFPQPRQISFFTLDIINNSITNAFITIEGDAQFLATNVNQAGQAEFVSLNTAALSEGNSLSFFEQLGPTTFIERTFHLLSPDYLLGAAVTDLNHDNLPDIVYAYRSGDTSAVELGIAFGDSSYSMRRRVVSREFPFSNVKQILIWIADFDNDSILDLFAYAEAPAGYFLIAKGKGEGIFYDPKIVGSGLSIQDRCDVQIVDVDGDGYPDIVVRSKRPAHIGWFRNIGNCNFASEQLLISDEGLNHFVVADVNGDGINDLAVTFGKKGVLKIINGKRLSFRLDTTGLIR